MIIEQYKAKNQYIVRYDNLLCFHSYRMTICCIKNNEIFLNKDYWNNYQSKTTNRYLYNFLNEFSVLKPKRRSDIEKYIKENKINFVDLESMKKELLK